MADTDPLGASEAPLLDHLIELRARLLLVLAVFAATLSVCLFFAGDIFAFLLWPF